MVETLVALLLTIFGSSDTNELNRSEVEATLQEYDIPGEVVQAYFQDGNGQITFGENSVSTGNNTSNSNSGR